jgi:hypothetical protein
VIPPARTGNARTSKIDVTKTDQIKSGILNKLISIGLILIIVTIILIAPNIDEAPAKCMLKIAKSTAAELCPIILLSGGYKVQPVPAPPTFIDNMSK